jgi:hypothetical protein
MAELLGVKVGAQVGVTALKTPTEEESNAAKNAPRERAPGERTPEERSPRQRDRAAGGTQKVTE